MRLEVLGCSGGIGTREKTTSLLVDDDILIDAGTGAEELSIEALTKIDHVFLTHSHLDHIAALPLLVDSVGSKRSKPILVHALPDTIAALRAHIFNWVIWPDFTEIPHFDNPFMKFEPLAVGANIEVGGRRIRVLPANHTVPAVGFQIAGPAADAAMASIVFTGDTSPNDAFWQVVNGIRDLRYLIIETAFANREQDLAVLAKHLFPIQLGQELQKLKLEPEILITHMKPADQALIQREIGAWAGRFAPQFAVRGMVIDL